MDLREDTAMVGKEAEYHKMRPLTIDDRMRWSLLYGELLMLGEPLKILSPVECEAVRQEFWENVMKNIESEKEVKRMGITANEDKVEMTLFSKVSDITHQTLAIEEKLGLETVEKANPIDPKAPVLEDLYGKLSANCDRLTRIASALEKLGDR